MLASRPRFMAAIFLGGFGLAACGGGGSMPPSAPVGQSAHEQSPTMIMAGYCVTHRFTDVKIRPIRAASYDNVRLSGCGMQSGSRKTASLWQTSAVRAFNVPGAITASTCKSYELFNDCGTLGFAINPWGTIVGPYLDSNAVITAFIRTAGGKYRSFQAPGAGLGMYLEQGTVPYEITNDGTIAGVYEDARYVYHGFVRHKDGSFLTYEAPWASRIPNDTVEQGTYTATLNSSALPLELTTTLAACLTALSAAATVRSFGSFRPVQ